MRNRSIVFPWPSEASITPDDFQPVDVPYLVADYWYFDVKSWWLDVDVLQSDGVHYTGGGEVGWNYTNLYTVSPGVITPGFPISEAYLALGWQINGFTIAGVFEADLFSTAGATVTSGRGIEYDVPANITKPYLRLSVGLAGIITRRSGTSAVTCTVDGLSVPVGDGPFVSGSGFIDFSPYSWWEYKKADNSNPMYDATGAPILPRQTDELA